MSKLKNYIGILSSWGNFQKIKSRLHFMIDKDIPSSLKDEDYIVYANGRSYGDCALNNNTIHTNKLNTIIFFDSELGIIKCESGILLSDIISKIVPEKWFLPVTPGTKHITLGGAIAADVHGKNHHKSGCFSHYIISLQLTLPNGSILTCSKTENSNLFEATCGGMGLTGVILNATFQLTPIKSAFIEQKTIATTNLKDTFKAFDNYENATYVVAWIDSLSKNRALGKGLLFVGEHAKDNCFDISFPQKLNIPKLFPSFILNPLSIKFHNLYYYKKQKNTSGKVPLDTFFYPLDNMVHWNRIYGRKGFLQYQIVIPKVNGYEGISRLLKEVEKSKHTSYLTILKLLGKANNNYISFPLEGYTVAMDFKIKKGLWPFLEHLDTIVSEYNGRAYLAKDGRMSKVFFEQGYPKLERFRTIRKQYNLERLQSLQSKRLGL